MSNWYGEMYLNAPPDFNGTMFFQGYCTKDKAKEIGKKIGEELNCEVMIFDEKDDEIGEIIHYI